MKSGGVSHPDAAADKKLFNRLISEHEAKEAKIEGKKSAGRFARGGKVKHKGHQTNIAIVVPQKGATSAAEPQAGAAPSPGTTAAPAPPMPPGGMPPPGMPMRATGGKVIEGDASDHNLKKWGKRTTSNSFARGGRLPTAGSMSGVERKQMTAIVRGNRRGK